MIMTIGVPWADSGSQGAGGAFRRMRHQRQLSRRRLGDATEGVEDALGLRCRPRYGPPGDLRPDLVQAERELGDHAEVAAPATQRPEQLGVLVARCACDRSVGKDDLDRLEVVHRPAEATGEVSEAATQRQPGDAGERDEAERRREAVLLGRPIDVAEEGAGLDAREPRARIHLDRVLAGHVERHAAVGQREAGDVVSSTPDRQLDAVLRDEAHGADDVVDRCGPHDDRGSLRDHAVPQRHRFRVPVVIGGRQRSVQITGEGVEERRVQLLAAAVEAGDRN